MTYTIALEFEQEQRILNDYAALDNLIEEETDKYYQGEFDGRMGIEGTHPEDEHYWRGYQQGYRFYLLKKQNKLLEQEF